MVKQKDCISYDVYELDYYALHKKIEQLDIKEVIVYGIGNNGIQAHRLLTNMGVKEKYYVDVKARDGVRSFCGVKVIAPEEMPKQYGGEYIVVSPSIHDSIVRMMKAAGIPEDKILLAFYKTEEITIDYGNGYGDSPSDDIPWCKEKPKTINGCFITIAYNTPENLFRRAIESVLKQTCKELKYLIIVNGPTDRTAEIAKEYAKLDARIQVVEMPCNLRWTDPILLNAIKDHVEGEYCCQLDSDDYYSETFLEETLAIGNKNNADIVCVRTCLFSADSQFDPLEEGLAYDWHDKYFFNVTHPLCHFIGHKNIMEAYSRSQICSTFWGKLYATSLMKRYMEYLLNLPKEDRELYYRLDIAMTYRILAMAERVFYSDKALHFSQYSKKNSTFTLAPIEWLMSLWYAYKGLKSENDLFYVKNLAKKYSKSFLAIHLPWMVGRKGMLSEVDAWENKERIIAHFKEMLDDPIFVMVLLRRKYMKEECTEFYETIKKIVEN